MYKIDDYIYEVYKEKSFTSASKKLFVSQPALSASIKKVENELGIEIFDRASKPLKLTETGELYIKMIEDTARIRQDFNNIVYEINNLKKGSITIGGANFMSSCVLPEIIKKFSTDYSGITINLVESNSEDLKEKALNGDIDIVLDYGFDDSLFEEYLLKSEKIFIAVPKNYQMNNEIMKYAIMSSDIKNGEYLKKKAIPLKLLKDEKFILLKKGNDMEERAIRIFKENDIKPECTLRLDQLMTAYNVSMKGLGMCFVTDTLINSSCNNDALYFKLDSKYSERKIYIAHKKNISPRKSVKRFIEVALGK